MIRQNSLHNQRYYPQQSSVRHFGRKIPTMHAVFGYYGKIYKVWVNQHHE
jgi:hypothetical protein